MILKGSNIIAASRAAVWLGLNDPVILKQCIPGCDFFERESATFLRARVVARISLIKMAFTGSVTQSEIQPPESCRLAVTGEGGIVGLVSADALVRLTATGPAETRIDYELHSELGGRLAKFSSSLISSTAQDYATRFFDRLAQAIAAQGSMN